MLVSAQAKGRRSHGLLPPPSVVADQVPPEHRKEDAGEAQRNPDAYRRPRDRAFLCRVCIGRRYVKMRAESRRRGQVSTGTRDQGCGCTIPGWYCRSAERRSRLFPAQSAGSFSQLSLRLYWETHCRCRDDGRHRQRRHASRNVLHPLSSIGRGEIARDGAGKTTFLVETRNGRHIIFKAHLRPKAIAKLEKTVIYRKCLRRDDACFAISGSPIPERQAATTKREGCRTVCLLNKGLRICVGTGQIRPPVLRW